MFFFQVCDDLEYQLRAEMLSAEYQLRRMELRKHSRSSRPLVRFSSSDGSHLWEHWHPHSHQHATRPVRRQGPSGLLLTDFTGIRG